MSIADQIRKIDNVSTVFTLSGVQSLLSIENPKTIYNAVSYALRRSELNRISEGIFSFNNNYSKVEFANKFRKPSYISLYTVLQQSGIVFQPYSSIYVVSNRSETVNIDDQKYIYRKIKDEILLNPLGIEDKNGIYTATPERAICDKIYLDKDEYFDNLRKIDLMFMKEINDKVYQNNKKISKFILKYEK